MKRTLIAGTVISISCLGLWYIWNQQPSPRLHWHSLTHTTLTGFQLSKNWKNEIESTANNGTVVRAALFDGKLRPIEQVLQGIRFKLDSLYQDRIVPIPGKVYGKVSCPEEFRPAPLPDADDSSASKKGYWMYASEQMGLGTCNQSEVKYKALNFVLSCKLTNKLFEIKVFVPNDLADVSRLHEIYHGFTCD